MVTPTKFILIYIVSDFLKLLYEIRKLIVPRLETAEGFEVSFEWKNMDYKQVLHTTKELMKARKSTQFKPAADKNPSPRPLDRKHSAPQIQSSKVSSARSNQAYPYNMVTNSTYALSVSNPTESNIPSEVGTLKQDPIKNQQNYHSKSTNDLRSTRANSKDHLDYHPLNSRFNLIESAGSKYSNESPAPDNRLDTNRRTTEDFLLAENMASVGSAIPKSNTISQFNDTFDHMLGEKLGFDEKKSVEVQINPAKSQDFVE
jgi:hypothetical protein